MDLLGFSANVLLKHIGNEILNFMSLIFFVDFTFLPYTGIVQLSLRLTLVMSKLEEKRKKFGISKSSRYQVLLSW